MRPAENAPIWSTATVRTTGMSPRRGRMNCRRASRNTNKVTVAMAERIAVAQSGETLRTSIFVTAQFDPHITTTMASKNSPAWRERI